MSLRAEVGLRRFGSGCGVVRSPNRWCPTRTGPFRPRSVMSIGNRYRLLASPRGSETITHLDDPRQTLHLHRPHTVVLMCFLEDEDFAPDGLNFHPGGLHRQRHWSEWGTVDEMGRVGAPNSGGGLVTSPRAMHDRQHIRWLPSRGCSVQIDSGALGRPIIPTSAVHQGLLRSVYSLCEDRAVIHLPVD